MNSNEYFLEAEVCGSKNSELEGDFQALSLETGRSPLKQKGPQMPVSELPASQSTGQQTSPDAVSVARPAVPASAPTLDEKTKLMQLQLVILCHAYHCQKREKQSTGEIRQCSLQHCQKMKQVINHMISCSAGKTCPVPDCASSRLLTSHWSICTRCDCLVCFPLRQAVLGNGKLELYGVQFYLEGHESTRHPPSSMVCKFSPSGQSIASDKAESDDY